MKRKKRFPQGAVSYDFETDGLEFYYGARPFIAGLEDEVGNVIRTRPGDGKWRVARGVAEDPDIEKVSHNAKFEMLMCNAMGWTPRGKWHCTLLMAAILYEYQRLSLGALTKRNFGRDHKDLIKEWIAKNYRAFRKEHNRMPNYSDVPPELLEEYLELDIDEGMRLYWLFRPALERAGLWEIYEMERRLLMQEVVPMEMRGVRIDPEHCLTTARKFKRRMSRIYDDMVQESKIKDLAPRSRPSLCKAFERLGIDTGEYGKDGLMLTNKDVLAAVSDVPFVKDLLLWRAYDKVVGTYLVPFTQKACHDVLHASFWQLGEDEGIKTGRFSCKNPNLENIPSGGKHDVPDEIALSVREAIIPRPGHAFVFGDYSQIEAILFFWYAGDEEMLARIAKGMDVYRANAVSLFEGFESMSAADQKLYRKDSKTVTLALQYGMGVAKMSRKLNRTYAEAKQLKDRFFYKMPSLRHFMMQSQRDLIVNGFVQDPYGKRYHVPTDLAYKACNALSQGFAAGILKRGVLSVGPEIRGLAQTAGIDNIIHDEIMAEVPIDKVPQAVEIMRECMPPPLELLGIPIRVDVKVAYRSWRHKEEPPTRTPGRRISRRPDRR